LLRQFASLLRSGNPFYFFFKKNATDSWIKLQKEKIASKNLAIRHKKTAFREIGGF
jgi:hypothetical protein